MSQIQTNHKLSQITFLITMTILVFGNPDKASTANSGSKVDLSRTRKPIQGECMPKSSLYSNPKAGQDMGMGGEMCKKMPWNNTYATNLLGVDTRSTDSAYWMGTWQPLVEVGCSRVIEQFLCALAVPLCHSRDVGTVYILPPCRELCELAKDGCGKIMLEYGFNWPIECEVFPIGRKQDDQTTATNMCVPPRPLDGDDSNINSGNGNSNTDSNTGKNTSSNSNFVSKDQFMCPQKLKIKPGLGYSFLEQEDCSAPCKSVLFPDENYSAARYWIGCWSFICFVSSLFTFFTYLVDRERFKYPERPIIILSTCYVFISGTFLVGFITQDAVSCNSNDLAGSSKVTNTAIEVVTQSVSHAGCTVSFIVLYYFLMASSLWWVNLSFTWFLAAGLKWSQEAIEKKSVFFHVIAWIVPLLQTILVLFFQGIEGDDISGTCFTGILNPQYTRFFVLLPLVLFILIGFIFLMCGFVSMCRVRHFIKKEGNRTDKLEKLMMRIGIFSLFYMVPAVILIACFFYEQKYRSAWHMNWWKDQCNRYDSESTQCLQIRSRGMNNMVEHPTANFYVFLLRYFVTLAVGVTSSFWLWSKKTFTSWRNLFCAGQIGNGSIAGSGKKSGVSLPVSAPGANRKMLQGGGERNAFV